MVLLRRPRLSLQTLGQAVLVWGLRCGGVAHLWLQARPRNSLLVTLIYSPLALLPLPLPQGKGYFQSLQLVHLKIRVGGWPGVLDLTRL